MTSIFIFISGATLLVYSAERLVGSLVGVSRGLAISVFLLAIIFTWIEFDDIVLGLAVIAICGIIIGAATVSTGTDQIIGRYGIEGTAFGATIVTAVLSIEAARPVPRVLERQLRRLRPRADRRLIKGRAPPASRYPACRVRRRTGAPASLADLADN